MTWGADALLLQLLVMRGTAGTLRNEDGKMCAFSKLDIARRADSSLAAWDTARSQLRSSPRRSARSVARSARSAPSSLPPSPAHPLPDPRPQALRRVPRPFRSPSFLRSPRLSQPFPRTSATHRTSDSARPGPARRLALQAPRRSAVAEGQACERAASGDGEQSSTVEGGEETQERERGERGESEAESAERGGE